MLVDTDHFVSMTLANQNFSRVVKMVEEKGYAVILKNNKARFLVISFDNVEKARTASESDLADITKEIAKQYRESHKDLF